MPLEVGSILEGKVTGITKFGAFVALEGGKSGMVHVSEISNEFVADIKDFLKEGQTVRVKVISVDEKGRINLSVKRVEENASAPSERRPRPSAPRRPAQTETPHEERQLTFEEMMAKFKKTSDDKLADLGESKEFRKANYAKRSHK